MSNQEILEKAIQKAIDSGWDSFGTETRQIDVEVVEWLDGELQPSDVDVDKSGIYICLYRPHVTYSVPELIFNHDFAKALWGEHSEVTTYEHQLPEGVKHGDTADGSKHTSKQIDEMFNTRYRCKRCDKLVRTYQQLHGTCYKTGAWNEGWEHHLQQMVIADDPIKYLGDHLNG